MKKKLAKAQKGKVTGSEQGTGAKILRTAGMAVPIVGGGIMAIAARRKAKKAQREAQKYTDEKLKGTQNKNAEGAKEFKRGGMKKPLRKAQYGDVVRVPGMKKSQAKAEEFYDKNPSVRTYTNEYTGKKIPTGPMTKKEYQDAAERAADVYPEMNGPRLKKGGAMKRMKTGGMVNSNAKVSALKSARSKGVKSGVNAKASASKRATGRVGGISAAPKTALPKAQKGGAAGKKAAMAKQVKKSLDWSSQPSSDWDKAVAKQRQQDWNEMVMNTPIDRRAKRVYYAQKGGTMASMPSDMTNKKLKKIRRESKKDAKAEVKRIKYS